MGNKQDISKGLTSQQAAELQKEFGRNELSPEKKKSFFLKALGILREPMFILLIAAAFVYFLLGEPRDGSIMLVFVVAVIGIEIFQEWRTDQTLDALKNLSAPTATVIRDGAEIKIPSVDLVPGDLLLVTEGVKIPADGAILKASDLRVDESSLTGESVGVWKVVADRKGDKGSGTLSFGDKVPDPLSPVSEDYWRRDYCYAGTLVTQGSATILVDKIGAQTEYGKIGTHIAEAPERPTPLEKQISRVVKVCVLIAVVFCTLAVVITYFNLAHMLPKNRLIDSVLAGITLAMAMIPEEFPVVLTVFLSMGAWRLARKHSLIRRLPALETLGAISVLCVDKTGTITQNRMTVTQCWSPTGNDEVLTETMGLACETETYDPMEQAMLRFCEERGITTSHLFDAATSQFISEYAFTDETKMMGHVWVHEGRLTIAAKGSPESILAICELTPHERQAADEQLRVLSERGLRVIAVASAHPASREALPASLPDCRLALAGLIGLADPPREGVAADIAQCQQAGIRVVMITGDNGLTASAIAAQVGTANADQVCTGADLAQLNDEELCERVKTVNIFSRVLPADKMRIVKAFRANGAIVAMTGDGVNDAPALKYADIGIAMGKRGSEVSREAADLILLDDNFATITATVKDGRRIYENIRKAIGYIFTIHIPIMFTALLAPLLHLKPAELMLLPAHVLLLELIIDPTCSIVFERQPAERDIMDRPPRDPAEGILSRAVLVKSLLQGLCVFAASFGLYYYSLRTGAPAPVARAMGLCVVFIANLFLVQVNSSNTAPVTATFKYLIGDRVILIVNAATLIGIAVILYTPLAGLFQLAPLRIVQVLVVIAAAAVSVFWYEIVKAVQRHKQNA
ncbi:MAG: cation-translocating P-type ATPase [Coriobacteriia bacterium]|nr:cation-translocating P-type ATPase [Coriobacteriia bacterium]